MKFPRRSLAALGLVAILAGCHGGSSHPQTASSTAPSAAVPSSLSPTSSTQPPKPGKTLPPFTAPVDLSGYGENCDEPDTKPEERCWLPTQFEPRVRKGETVTLRNKWPKQGDEVDVACDVIHGEGYYDGNGVLQDRWFGILVPADKLEPHPVPGTSPNVGRIPTRINGKFLVYVQAAWLLVRGDGAMNDCKDLQK